MNCLVIDNLEYLSPEAEGLAHGGAFKVPSFKVGVAVDSDAKTIVKSGVEIAPAPYIGLKYDLGLASGIGLAFAFSINEKPIADVNITAGFSR